MKLSELDAIRHLLPDDLEVTLGEYEKKPKGVPLEKQTWGNHDGRWNAKCPVCGWVSQDLPAGAAMPAFCPDCGNGVPFPPPSVRRK